MSPPPTMGECVFCRIVAGNEPAQTVHRWADATAIVPINPVTPGHVLVIPRMHVRDATEAPYVTAQAMLRAASLAKPPCNIITSAGAEATQTVPHLHIHVVPRQAGDGLMLPWSRQGNSQSDGRVTVQHRIVMDGTPGVWMEISDADAAQQAAAAADLNVPEWTLQRRELHIGPTVVVGHGGRKQHPASHPNGT